MQANFINDPYLIKIDEIFSRDFCFDVINTYENVSNEEKEKIDLLSICNKGNAPTCDNCNCLRIDLMQHEAFTPYFDYILDTLQSTIDYYKQQAFISSKQFPSRFAFENLKIKRYLPNTDQGMSDHIDVFSKESSRRFLAFIIYLNDNFEGGETVFLRHDIKIKPKTGTVVIFPPYWPWLHSANKVISGEPKYFMGTYLHYVD